jgi:NhaP-type Na+/H+ or K+/H+ antiporter
LYICIFGESALNDAVAVILFRFISELAKHGTEIDALTFFTTTGLAIGVFCGAVAFGYLIGMLLALILKHIDLKELPYVEVTMVLIFAYCSYLGSEAFHLSGIVSILFCGMAVKYYPSL